MNPSYYNMFNEPSSRMQRATPMEPSSNALGNASQETNGDINSRGFLPTLGDLQSVGWSDCRPMSSPLLSSMRQHSENHRPSSPHGMQFHSNLIPSHFPSPLSIQSALDSYHNPSAQLGHGCTGVQLPHRSQFPNHPGRIPPAVSNGPKFAYGRCGETNSVDGRLKSNAAAAKLSPIRIAPKKTVPIAPKPPIFSAPVSSEAYCPSTSSQPPLNDPSPSSSPEEYSSFDICPDPTSPISTRPASTKRGCRKGGNGNLPNRETTNVLRNFLTSEHRSTHQRPTKPVKNTVEIGDALPEEPPIAKKRDPKAVRHSSIKFSSNVSAGQQMRSEYDMDVDGEDDDVEANVESEISQNLSIVREHNELLVYQNESKRKYAFMRQTNDRTSNNYRPSGVTREQAMAAMDKALVDDAVFSFSSYCRTYTDHLSHIANSMSNLTSTYLNSSSWEDCFSDMYSSPPSVVYKEMESYQLFSPSSANERPLSQTQTSYTSQSSSETIHDHSQPNENNQPPIVDRDEEITPVYLPNLSRILFMSNTASKKKSSTDPLRRTQLTGGIKKQKRSHGSAKF